MTSRRPHGTAPARPVVLGLRARRGGAVAVAVAVQPEAPEVVLSSVLPTAEAGDRLALEPYCMAAEMASGRADDASAEIAAAVAEGRRRQVAMASAGLDRLVGELRAAGREPVLAALLVNRARWVTDLLRYSLAMPGHAPVAEGLAVRDALRRALERAGLATTETDETSLPDLASTVLGLPPASIESRIRDCGKTVGAPWRRRQKLACLAAWVAGRQRIAARTSA